MAFNLTSRLTHAWNAFIGRDPTYYHPGEDEATTYYYRPDRPRMRYGNERSIVASIYNRIAMDVASVTINHARLDSSGRFKEIIDSDLNSCLNLSANRDQTGRAFIQDAVLSMLDEGVVALCPIDTDTDPDKYGSAKIYTIRTGRVVAWMPHHVKVEVYNENRGERKELVFPKNTVAIIENPFYSIMNEPNSTLQRLIRKLNLLDHIDEQTGSNKLDLIIKLPYVIKSEARKIQADNRRNEITRQLSSSEYGIAYVDGTEDIVQLNRSVENNLMEQIEYLTSMLYSQLGLTAGIMDDTADERTMINYNNRTIEPILAALCDEMKRKFLSPTARTQHQTITFFRDPFRLVPVSSIAEIADKFTRNEIMSSNEIRQVIGMKPIDDVKADELRNKNLSPSDNQQFAVSTTEDGQEEELQNDI